MSFALSAGVTGLQAHQKMIDIAGNNLANVNTTAFKSSRITFSELLSETIKKASQPTTDVGGTNPQQMGSGVGVAGITPNMTQGNIVNTGNPLDLAIEGEGYFVLSDGQQPLYTRAGAFGVDGDSNLVDPATGYRVQRYSTMGVDDGFQDDNVSDLHVPYDVPIDPKATSQIVVSGNLSADSMLVTPQTQLMGSNITYTDNGTVAIGTTLISALDQYTGTLSSGVITFDGYKPNGDPLGSSPTTDLTMDVTATTTVNDVLDHLNKTNEVQTLTISGCGGVDTFTLSDGIDTTSAIAYNATAATVQAQLIADIDSISAGDVVCAGGPLNANAVTITFQGNLAAQDVTDLTIDTTNLTGTGTVVETIKGSAVQGVLDGATASLVNGQIRITDSASGYSRTDLSMAWSGDGTLTMPGYFEMLTVGGNEVKNVNIMTYDSLGGKHVFSGALVRTNTANTWDMVLTSMSGNVNQITMPNRRIEDITFDQTSGYYNGLGGSDPAEFVVSYASDPLNPQTIALDFGTIGKLNGLTQFAGNSTAVAKEQDGYEPGNLSTVSVSNDGIVIGAFSNGIKKNTGDLKIALFQNTSGLESIGGGYFTNSANSGEPAASQAMTGGAGSIHGGALEKSNADVATQFVSMIQAQNGFQANARTIRVANDILRELSNLIR